MVDGLACQVVESAQINFCKPLIPSLFFTLIFSVPGSRRTRVFAALRMRVMSNGPDARALPNFETALIAVALPDDGVSGKFCLRAF